MRRRTLISALSAVTVAMAFFTSASTVSAQAAKVTAATPEEAGKYLLIIGSCHDCHTAGWTESKGKVAEDDYMAGNPVGYKGAWGTSYGKNLRTITARQSEDHWVEVLKTADGGDGKLPMPYHNMALMNEDDMRNMYKYIKSLGTKVGPRLPRAAKPGVEPTGDYIELSQKKGAAPPDTTKKPK
jgi:mono/diheme cytochrome c family protein